MLARPRRRRRPGRPYTMFAIWLLGTGPARAVHAQPAQPLPCGPGAPLQPGPLEELVLAITPHGMPAFGHAE